MSKKDTAPEPMDPGAQETTTPVVVVNHPRVCYAAQTLVAEVETLFPETPVEYANVNGRNVSLDVIFDLSSMDGHERDNFTALLELCRGDLRIAEVVVADESDQSSVLVSFHNSALTQDLREPFGLEEAWLVMAEGYDEPSIGIQVPAMLTNVDEGSW